MKGYAAFNYFFHTFLLYSLRAFVKLREILSTKKVLATKLKELDGKIGKHDEEISLIFKAIRQLMVPPEKKKPKIGFKREKG